MTNRLLVLIIGTFSQALWKWIMMGSRVHHFKVRRDGAYWLKFDLDDSLWKRIMIDGLIYTA
jgi:hypothetical protein